MRYLKGELQRKGTKSSKRHLRRIRKKEQRQSRDVIHCAVNEVLKTEASIIAVEDLDLRAKKYRKSSNRRRFSVPLSEFVRILEYKAKLRGKQVLKVKPNFTSQDDCRGLERGKRMGGKYIGKDGAILHSDINAACNIALRAKETFKLDNLVSVVYRRNMTDNINKQATVNSPIVDGSHSQASIPLG
jgi:IS605 OrfB family transposase